MDLARRDLYIALAIALGSMLLLPPFLGDIDLLYLAPFLIIFWHQNSILKSAWMAWLCGLVPDLFSDQRFGVFAVIYTLVTFLLYRQKRHFFSDSIFTIPAMCFCFSCITFFCVWGWQQMDVGGEGKSLGAIFAWILSVAFFNAIYAFLIFGLPFLWLGDRRRRGGDYFSR